ncbi:hypothetical protein IFR05_003408 [Cadophora sp. M221]|nr:hypothetical protein IFR05_003408 [Cadophora sp. M221]
MSDSNFSAFISPLKQKASSSALNAARDAEAFDHMDIDDSVDIRPISTEHFSDGNPVEEVGGDNPGDLSRIEMVSAEAEALEKAYQVEKNDKNLYLIPPVVSAKKSSYARLVDGYNPYKVDGQELRKLRMKFENAKGRRVMNLRFYDVIAMLHDNIEDIHKSKKQSFVDLLKTLEQKWRDANKPREAKKISQPHPRSSADYLRLMHSLKPVEPSCIPMGIDADGPKGAKSSTSSESIMPIKPNKSTDNSRDFLEAPQGITPPTTPTKSINPSPAKKAKAVLSKEEEEEHP